MITATRRGDPYAVDRIREAAALLRHRASRSTPGPWRLGNYQYAALVADQPHPSRDHAENGGWAWDDGYDGCLIGESMMAADRVYPRSGRSSRISSTTSRQHHTRSGPRARPRRSWRCATASSASPFPQRASDDRHRNGR